jgi:hypothetical protein
VSPAGSGTAGWAGMVTACRRSSGPRPTTTRAWASRLEPSVHVLAQVLPKQSSMWVLALLVLALPGIVADDDAHAPGVDERRFLDNLDGMSPKELKHFVRANGKYPRASCCPAGRPLDKHGRLLDC